jgi:hypothetical protein
MLLTTVNFGGREEMGHYRVEVPQERGKELRAILTAADVSSLPDPEPSLPTTPFVFVGEGQVGSPPAERRAFPVDAVPDPLVPVLDAVHGLAQELLEHPYRAIRGVAGPIAPVFTPGQDLAVDLTLENIGVAPLVLRNPAGARSAAEVGLQLGVNALSSEGLRGPGALLRFGRDEVARVDQDGATPPADQRSEIELEPGEILQLRMRKPVLMSLGRYDAYVLYRSFIERPDVQRSVLGDLRVSAGTFRFGGSMQNTGS